MDACCRSLTRGPHVIAGHRRDNVVVGLVLLHVLGRRSKVLLQRGRIQAYAVTPLRVHGSRTVRQKTKVRRLEKGRHRADE